MSRFRPSRNYVSGKVVFDGGPVDISGDLVVSGTITANEYQVNVINTNVTHIDADGNTKFGDTPDDTHQFTGSVFINGQLSASSIVGGGLTTPGAPDTSVQFNNAGSFAGDPDFTWDNAANALTVNGDITASVNISGAFFYGDGSGLTDITATAFPAGSNTEIQYNANGALGADADFTWSSGSNVLNVNGSITSSAMTISSSSPTETLLRVDSYEVPYLFSVDASSSLDGAPRLMMRNSNDDITEPAGNLGRGLFHIEQESTSSAAIEANGLSIWTYAQNNYSSKITLSTWDPPVGAGSEIQFFTNDGTFPIGGVIDNQALGRMCFGGWDGNDTYLGSLIVARAVENWNFDVKNGTDIEFYTVPIGKGQNSNLKERIRFTSEGHLIVFPYSASNDDALPINTNYDKSAGAPALQVYGPTLFGSSSASTHIFTGSVNITGSLTASANVSASFFYGDGSNLTNLTIPSGTIGRVDSTGAETFYLSISGAVAASVAGDYVHVGPGTYIEDSPINIPAGVSVIGEAGWQVTEVSSSTGLGDLFVLTAGSLLKNFNIAIPSDTGSYGAKFAGATGTATVNFLSFYGGTGLRGSGYGNTGTGKTIGLEIRYSTGDCDAILEVTDGILAVEGVHVPNTAGSVDVGMRANSPSVTRVGNRGRLQGIDVNMGATGVEDGIVAGSTSTVVLQGINLFNIQNTFHLTSNSASLLVTSGLSDPTVNDIKVDAGLTGDGSLTRLSAFMNGVFDIPTTWIPSDHAWTFFTSQDHAAGASQQLWGANQIIGHPEFGSGISAGEGTGYSTNNTIFTTTNDAAGGSNGSNFIDVSTAGESVEGSTFSFQSASAGCSIMWCTKRKDASNTTLKHWGLEVDQVAAAETGSGNFILEYQDASSSWVEVGAMAVSEENQYRYANNLFLRANSAEHIFAGITGTPTWPETTINSVTGHWMRFRIESPVTTAPTFERFRLIPSVSSINNRGNRISKGLAMWNKSIDVSQVKWQGANLSNADISVGIGPAWTQKIERGKMDGASDTAEAFLIIPQGVCTAHPLTVKIYYGFESVAGPTTLGLSVVQVETALNMVADPAGGVTPIPRSFASTALTTANSPFIPTNVVSPAPTTAKSHVVVAEFSNIDISGYYAGDLIFLQLDTATSFGSQIQLLGMGIEGIAFAEQVIE